jgi:hypothetical protein
MSTDSVSGSTVPPDTLPADEVNATPESALDDTTPGGYAYGPPPTIVRDSNYISDENLLVWLAQKQDGLYGELRDHMDTSRARSKLMADLNHLKGEVDRGMSPAEAKAEIEALLEKYAGTEFEGALNELFAGPLAEIELILERSETTELGNILSDQFLEQLSGSVQSKVDELGRDDQLELIEIQSLTADIREGSQLASNLVASSNQASNTIVGTIGR